MTDSSICGDIREKNLFHVPGGCGRDLHGLQQLADAVGEVHYRGDSSTFEPDAETIEAWKLRRAVIGGLVQEGKTVHKPAYLSVERNGLNEITLIFLAVRGDTISVFFDGEVVDDISYYTGERTYTTYPCLPVVDAPGSDECVDSAEEATARFSALIKQFDKHAREAFHKDYKI